MGVRPLPDGLGQHVVQVGEAVGRRARRAQQLCRRGRWADEGAGPIAGDSEATAQVWRLAAAVAVTSDVDGTGWSATRFA